MSVKLTGKRVSSDVHRVEDRTDRYPQAPLVPDISLAQKAMIREQLSRTMLYTQVMSQSTATLVALPQEKYESHAAIGVESIQVGLITDLKSTETRSQKIGRKLKSLFMNDQTVKVRRKDSAGFEGERRCNRLPYLDDEEDVLYRQTC